MPVDTPRLTFISYSRADGEFALQLAQELRSAGFQIWLDQLDIPTGAHWDDEIEKALEQCQIFMVILTPDSTASDNVKDEISFAIDSGKRILPVLLENAKLPLRLRRLQYVDFTKKSYDDGIGAAKQLLRRLLDESLPAPSTAISVKQEVAVSPPKRSETNPTTAESVAQQKAIAIQQARQRERLERENYVSHPIPPPSRKDPASRSKPFSKTVSLLAGVGLFSIVCLIVGSMSVRNLIWTPDAPVTETPSLTGITPSHTSTPTLTPSPTSTPTATLTDTFTPTVTPFAPLEPGKFMIWFFDTLIKEDNFDLARSLMTPDFDNNTFEKWRANWDSYDEWTVGNIQESYKSGDLTTIVSANYTFGAWNAGKIEYCLIRDETRNTWMLDALRNCPR